MERSYEVVPIDCSIESLKNKGNSSKPALILPSVTDPQQLRHPPLVSQSCLLSGQHFAETALRYLVLPAKFFLRDSQIQQSFFHAQAKWRQLPPPFHILFPFPSFIPSIIPL